MSSLTGELTSLIDKAIETGANFDDIGKMAFIAKEVEAKFQSVITRVDASREYVEQRGRS